MCFLTWLAPCRYPDDPALSSVTAGTVDNKTFNFSCDYTRTYSPFQCTYSPTPGADTWGDQTLGNLTAAIRLDQEGPTPAEEGRPGRTLNFQEPVCTPK